VAKTTTSLDFIADTPPKIPDMVPEATPGVRRATGEN
jgi:hypothetical protein